MLANFTGRGFICFGQFYEILLQLIKLDKRKEFLLVIAKIEFRQQIEREIFFWFSCATLGVKCPLTLLHRRHLCQARVVLCQAHLKYPYSVDCQQSTRRSNPLQSSSWCRDLLLTFTWKFSTLFFASCSSWGEPNECKPLNGQGSISKA